MSDGQCDSPGQSVSSADAAGEALKTDAPVTEPQAADAGVLSQAPSTADHIRRPSPGEVSEDNAATSAGTSRKRRKPKAAQRVPDILTGEDLERFEQFWAKWQKKIRKKDAAVVWAQLNVDGELFDRIMAGADRYNATEGKGKDVRYIPDARTWLNGARWDDEMPVGEVQLLTGEEQERFRLFWDAWPRKVGRKDAEEAFARMNVTDEMLGIMLHNITESERKVWFGRESQYIPHAASWLSSGRWKEEVQDVKTSQDVGYEKMMQLEAFQEDPYADEPDMTDYNRERVRQWQAEAEAAQMEQTYEPEDPYANEPAAVAEEETPELPTEIADDLQDADDLPFGDPDDADLTFGDPAPDGQPALRDDEPWAASADDPAPPDYEPFDWDNAVVPDADLPF